MTRKEKNLKKGKRAKISGTKASRMKPKRGRQRLISV